MRVFRLILALMVVTLTACQLPQTLQTRPLNAAALSGVWNVIRWQDNPSPRTLDFRAANEVVVDGTHSGTYQFVPPRTLTLAYNSTTLTYTVTLGQDNTLLLAGSSGEQRMFGRGFIPAPPPTFQP